MPQVKPVSVGEVITDIRRCTPEIRLIQQYTSRVFVQAQQGCLVLQSHLKNVTWLIYRRSVDVQASVDLFKYTWVASHVVTASGSLIVLYYRYFFLAGNNRYLASEVWYYVSLWGAVFTYLLVSYKYIQVAFTNYSKLSTQPQFINFITIENFQLLAIALLSLSCHRVSPVKVVPFTIYSLMNLSSYLFADLLGSTSFALTLMPFLNYLKEPLLAIASYFELVVLVLFFKDAILDYKLTHFVLYSFLYGLRLDNSYVSRQSFHNVFTQFYSLLEFLHCPPFILIQYQSCQRKLLFFFPIDLEQNDDKSNKNITDDTSVLISSSHKRYSSSLKTHNRLNSLVFDTFPVINDLIS